MAFPTGSVPTDNLDNVSDSPASAREDLLLAVQKLNDIIASYDSADGIAALDSGGQIVNTKLPAALVSASGNVTITPASNILKVANFVELTPVAYASLPGSPVNGQIAFLTTDGASATKNKPIYHNGTDWKYFNDDSIVAAS
jgi:hypothetical protein